MAGHSHTGPLRSSSWWAWLSLGCGIPGQAIHEIQVYTEAWHQGTNKRGYLLHLIIRGPAHLPPELYPPLSLGGHLDLGSHTPGVTGGSHCSRFLSEEVLRTCHRGKGPDMDSSYRCILTSPENLCLTQGLVQGGHCVMTQLQSARSRGRALHSRAEGPQVPLHHQPQDASLAARSKERRLASQPEPGSQPRRRTGDRVGTRWAETGVSSECGPHSLRFGQLLGPAWCGLLSN